MIYQRFSSWVMAVAFSFLGSTVGFGLTQQFPKLERIFLDWQLTHESGEPTSSRIVLVGPPGALNNACGQGRWHPDQMARFLEGFKLAGSSAVVSLEGFTPTSSSGCEDLGSLARLAETTKRSGNVVFPDSTWPMLRKAAAGTGRRSLAQDEDGIVRGLTIPSTPDSSHTLPLGLVAASLIEDQKNAPLRKGEKLYFLRPNFGNFSEVSYKSVKDLIEKEEAEVLRDLFQKKIIFLSSDDFRKDRGPIHGASGVSPIFLHARIADSALKNSWLALAPFPLTFLWTWSGGMALAYLILKRHKMKLKVFLGFSLFLIIFVGIWSMTQIGYLWPVSASLAALGFTAFGSLAGKAVTFRTSMEGQIRDGQRALVQLEKELFGKQGKVRELETRLAEFKTHAEESVSVISGLHESRETILRKLQDSEEAVAKTQARIAGLQTELASLRRQVPMEGSVNQRRISQDRQSLIHDCESLNILTRDPKVLDQFLHLKKGARTGNPILLLGETGTGKEVFARAAHALSSRQGGPFISVNMAAIRPELFEAELFGHVKGAYTGAVGREGLLEAAHGGTLFLDEVGELPADVQAKLLRVLEDGSFYRVGDSRLTQVDVRILAATNRPLQEEVEAGRYREDLYYRLRSIVLCLPPLRERCREDLLALARSFLATFAEQLGRKELEFSQGAMEAIFAYGWPGNIRELRQTIAQAVALADGPVIAETDLRLPEPGGKTSEETAHGMDVLRGMEDDMVLKYLRRNQFDMQATARDLGWNRCTVTQRLKGLAFQALVEHRQNFHAAALSLAGNEVLARVVENRLRKYSQNLLSSAKAYRTAEEALKDCRKRFRNIPERHFPAVERLIQERFARP